MFVGLVIRFGMFLCYFGVEIRNFSRFVFGLRELKGIIWVSIEG